ncbi:MAG TPA: alkaline phosphatase family protein [Candidatus Cybelea sp.]
MTACSSNGGATFAAPAGASRNSSPTTQLSEARGRRLTSQYISHVIVIVQENRSFENFFAGYPGANAPTSGCAIPKTGLLRKRVVKTGVKSDGLSATGCPTGDIKVALKAVTFRGPDQGPDLQHDWHSSKTEYNRGNMDGFSLLKSKLLYGAYTYVKRSEIQPYWSMAKQYVLADAMFPTEWGGSFTGHLTLVSGNDEIQQEPTQSEVDFPNGKWDDCDSPAGTKSSYVTAVDVEHFYQGPYPCFDQFNTIANVLDAGSISWKIYATKVVDGGMWEPFEAIKYTRYGPDWRTSIIAPQTKVLTDPGDGKLASVTWVTPSHADSDHPGNASDRGPSWVASVVNAIGQSSYWSSSAIVIVWDDWGGFYDNAKPPQLDYRGLGFRVPCLIISPYAKQGYVDDTQYEWGSILSFIEEVYGLPKIGPPSEMYTDTRATPLDNAFNFTQKPRAFVKINPKYSVERFLHEPPSDEPVDTE